MRRSKQGLLQIFPVLRRPGRVLAVTDAYCASENGLNNIDRGATPMRADAAWATPGFSGAPPSGPRSHPRRHDTGCAFGSARSSPFASAKQRRLRQAFITRPPPHPSHRIACEGPSARKNPPRTAEKQRLSSTTTSIGSMLLLALVCVAGASPR